MHKSSKLLFSFLEYVLKLLTRKMLSIHGGIELRLLSGIPVYSNHRSLEPSPFCGADDPCIDRLSYRGVVPPVEGIAEGVFPWRNGLNLEINGLVGRDRVLEPLFDFPSTDHFKNEDGVPVGGESLKEGYELGVALVHQKSGP